MQNKIKYRIFTHHSLFYAVTFQVNAAQSFGISTVLFCSYALFGISLILCDCDLSFFEFEEPILKIFKMSLRAISKTASRSEKFLK